VERVFGHQCLYLAARTASGSLAGVLPLVWVRSRIFGHYLVSMPFLNYGGPLGSDDAVSDLIGRASELANQHPGVLLEIRSRQPLDTSLEASHRKITVLLDLPTGDPRELWDGFRPKLRSQIRRPQKEGVSVRFGADQLDSFYRVFAQHMRDLGTPTLPRRFFEVIGQVFQKDVWCGVAYLGNVPVAAGCGFQWADEFEITWAGSLRRHNRIAPNMLLYWSFMERALRRGMRTFNFGRCTPEGGTHRFKRQWGSRDLQLYWYRQAAGENVSTPSPDDARYAWGPKVWKKLPVSVTNLLGPMVVRFIP
jgi:FemAB-related protein (PEP-CTERM system-associated)